MERLCGYDTSFELGRSAINKTLAALERIPGLWNSTYRGESQQPVLTELVATTRYELSLTEPRIRAVEEQPRSGPSGASPPASFTVWVNISGTAVSTLTFRSAPILSHDAALSGEVAVAVRAVVRHEHGQARVAITFSDAKVEHVRLRGLPDGLTEDLKPMIARAAGFILEREMRQRQVDLPLTGLIHLAGSPQGIVDGLTLKSHYYREEAGDLAVGLALCLGPNTSLEAERMPFQLRRCGHEDIGLSISIAYLNRLLGNAIADETEQRWRFGGSWDDPGTQGLTLRSVVCAPDGPDALALVIRFGKSRADVVARARLRIGVRDSRLTLDVADVDVDVPGIRGLMLKVITNVLYVVARFIAADVGHTELSRVASTAADLGSGLLLHREVFSAMPEGLRCMCSVAAVRVSADCLTLGFDYRAEVNEP